MKLFISLCNFFFLSLTCFVLAISCGKGGGNTPAPNPCSGVTVNVTGNTTNPSSQGAADGAIAVTASGGSGFTYSLNGSSFQNSSTFGSLAAGTYTVTAKNGNGCSGTATFTLTAPNPCAGVTITVTGTSINPTAAGTSDGSISATASGSSGFTYRLNGGSFQSSGNFSNLPAGTYIVTAKDVNGCTGTGNFTLTAPNACAGITILVTSTTTNVIPCQTPFTGSITASATGGASPYTFSLNTGTFQSANVFSNLNTGSYAVNAKDANGCLGSTNTTILNLPAGPLFTAVKSLLQAECVSCHNPSNTNGGMDWTVDCNIVTFRDRIKARAVDGNPAPMPPTGLLPASERQKITNWIVAGGRITD